MLQIDKLDKWRTHVKEKLRIHNAEPKQCHDEHKDGMNQFKAGDQVLLDKTDRRIATSKLNANRITPFTILNVFPYGTVEVTHSELGTFKRSYFETKMARQLVVLALVLIALVGVVSTDASSTGGSLVSEPAGAFTDGSVLVPPLLLRLPLQVLAVVSLLMIHRMVVKEMPKNH
ncbi:hypothetical protein Goklo_003495 [Gossypium klotzschianum]|uniref:Uncharacterized protein n=1 Tax=Gossypium klotzschianum TaxID=34286 RepID=A0A7J8VKR1_9ROSI|nr:hypothetical protein [Gossypium klotzschianum]